MISSNRTVKIKRSSAAVWRVIDGDVVVLIPEEATLHAFTGCGSRIWELMEGETTLSSIVDQICDEYEVEPERARYEVSEFVEKLISMNLVETISEASCAEKVRRQ